MQGERFRFLVVPKELYQYIGDPFVIQTIPSELCRCRAAGGFGLGRDAIAAFA